MRIHILGICGTFMAGIALLAREAGFDVSGSDQNVYPPMSTQLSKYGIQINSGYRAENLEPKPDLAIIGNALSRGNAEVEAVLDTRLPYVSGPQWLYEKILCNHWVLAVAGTHGKTSCSAMLAWILDEVGLKPGFLIGGVPINFGISARLGTSNYFVVEADEYDTAFFDKRSKFVHYRPKTAVLNNLEFDHADIFPDIDAIQRQFHQFVRTIPRTGRIIRPAIDSNLDNVIQRGCWTPIESTLTVSDESICVNDIHWSAILRRTDGTLFDIFHHGALIGSVTWLLTGKHNVNNALAAIAAASHAGVDPLFSIQALGKFKSIKRRMEIRSVVNGVTIYDDFAHHPTAVSTTLEGLRAHVGNERIIAVLEPRSNTMRLGVHVDKIPKSMTIADIAFIYHSSELPSPAYRLEESSNNIRVINTIDDMLQILKNELRSGDHVVFMSNGSFFGIHEKLQAMLHNA
ncbi:MAG: UDP-N-acetylmuramate:L-alanyl-gamma-D-glutamyl-meso-diaminopimelate ligase [Methylococcales bacterium]